MVGRGPRGRGSGLTAGFRGARGGCSQAIFWSETRDRVRRDRARRLRAPRRAALQPPLDRRASRRAGRRDRRLRGAAPVDPDVALRRGLPAQRDRRVRRRSRAARRGRAQRLPRPPPRRQPVDGVALAGYAASAAAAREHAAALYELASPVADRIVIVAAGDASIALAAADRATAERARLNVTRALRGAVAKIAAHDELLGRELSRSIRTGAVACTPPVPRRRSGACANSCAARATPRPRSRTYSPMREPYWRS